MSQNEGKKEKKKKKEYIVSVCTSQKSCRKKASQYTWERCCNEHNITDFETESFTVGNITFKQSGCMGMCKQGPNVRVAEDEKEKNVPLFSWMNPLKVAKLIKRLKSGNSPQDIKHL